MRPTQTPDVVALVIEDEPVSRLLAVCLLEYHGCRVRCHPSPAASLTATELARYDVVIGPAESVSAVVETWSQSPIPQPAPYLVALIDAASPTPPIGVDASVVRPMTPARVRAILAGLERARQALFGAIDPDMLADMTGGDLDLAAELAQDYVELAIGAHTELDEAYRANELVRVQKIAHRLVGCLGSIGARQAASQASVLSAAAQTGDLNTLPGAFANLASELPRVETAARALAASRLNPRRTASILRFPDLKDVGAA